MDNDFNRIRTFKSKKVKNTRRDATCPSTRESLAQRIASMFKGDPRCEVIANYEKECLRNSEESIQKLSLLLENWPLLKDTPQSSRSSLFELEDALSMLPKEHGVLYEQAQSFLELCRGRRPFHIEKMTFGFTSRNTSSVAHCMFWIKLLQPRAVSFYSTVDGLYLRAKDYHNLLVQEVDRVVVHDAANLSVALLSLIIKEWFCGKRNHLPALEITFHKSSRPRLEIDELLKKTVYKAPGNFRVLIDRKGDIKEIMKNSMYHSSRKSYSSCAIVRVLAEYLSSNVRDEQVTTRYECMLKIWTIPIFLGMSLIGQMNTVAALDRFIAVVFPIWYYKTTSCYSFVMLSGKFVLDRT
ncbi:hypothetical protein DICVIV_11330 [Dictyocaulus viviparus]|uniref:Uncharacterized protein n=1 Tax=Dictyocaulus viviparus TaxID=29172 RepID=A0A0D8XG59_DICVI|nr:hypothetical protein DICVIV_11330 [Dictyocaulus viviparus]